MVTVNAGHGTPPSRSTACRPPAGRVEAGYRAAQPAVPAARFAMEQSNVAFGPADCFRRVVISVVDEDDLGPQATHSRVESSNQFPHIARFISGQNHRGHVRDGGSTMSAESPAADGWMNCDGMIPFVLSSFRVDFLGMEWPYSALSTGVKCRHKPK